MKPLRLTERQLQRIFDRALEAYKQSMLHGIPGHLQVTARIIESLEVELGGSLGPNGLGIELPIRAEYQTVED